MNNHKLRTHNAIHYKRFNSRHKHSHNTSNTNRLLRNIRRHKTINIRHNQRLIRHVHLIKRRRRSKYNRRRHMNSHSNPFVHTTRRRQSVRSYRTSRATNSRFQQRVHFRHTASRQYKGHTSCHAQRRGRHHGRANVARTTLRRGQRRRVSARRATK